MIHWKIRIILALVMIHLGVIALGQIYQFGLHQNKKEIISVLAVNAGIQIYDYLYPPDPIMDFDRINSENLWSIDRSALDQQSQKAILWSDVLQMSSGLSPFFLYFSNQKDNGNMNTIILMGIHGFLAEYSVNAAFKVFGQRPRPYMYRDPQNFLNKKLSKTDLQSFYSGHTAASAYFSFFAAKVFADLHPGSKLKYAFYGLASAASMTTGYLRYKSGKHFPTDVVAAVVIGASFGIFVPEIYKSDNLEMKVEGSGLGLTLHF